MFVLSSFSTTYRWEGAETIGGYTMSKCSGSAISESIHEHAACGEMLTVMSSRRRLFALEALQVPRFLYSHIHDAQGSSGTFDSGCRHLGGRLSSVDSRIVRAGSCLALFALMLDFKQASIGLSA